MTKSRKPRLTAAERRAIDKANALKAVQNCERSIQKFTALRSNGDFTIVEQLMLFKLVINIKESQAEWAAKAVL